MTIKRNREWRNLWDLYSSDIKYLGKSAKANIEYAEYLTGTVYQDPNYQQYHTVNEFKAQTIISHFRTALKLFPNDYTTLNDLSAVYINFTPKPDSGIVFLKKAIALRPELQSAWVNMGMAYTKKNKIDSAISCYQKVLQINPNELNAVFKIADLFFEKGNVGKAMKINEDVIKEHPDKFIPYFNIGSYYFMLGDTLTAVRNWEVAAEKPDASYEVFANLSMMYKAKGNMEKANEYYYRAEDARKKRQGMENR
jgi:Tfp pilus assembly protein PilF